MTAAGRGNAVTERAYPALPPLETGKKLLARSRLLGRISAFIFFLAALAVFDGLQTLMRHEFNSIDIIPGEEFLVSGMLPGGAKSHEELIVTVEGEADIRFIPEETYKGFWMGGNMWRARLLVPSDSPPGRASIVIEDILPEEDKDETPFAGRQNPALIFAVNIYASERERTAADKSFIRRFTGLPAFGVAAGAVLGALAVGLANWRAFGKAEAILAEHGVFFIHGVKKIEDGDADALSASGYKTAFAHAGKKFYRDEPVLLYDEDWREQGKGRLVEVTKIKAFALFPLDGVAPRYGWLAARAGEEKP